ncbi:hypothetical protein Tco_1507942 [Tanacetum coccineum]
MTSLMLPVAPPSPITYQPHDPDYVSKPIYPEYIPLEDEHEFLAKEQPLPPVVSPTAELPGYVTELDPEEDPEGEDGDDDDDDSSRDDADDEDEDEGDEDDRDEEEEHLASTDSAIVVPTVELVSPPKGTEPGSALLGARPTCIFITTTLPSPLLPSSGCQPKSRSLKKTSIQALVDAVTAALPSPPLPPSLYIPPPVDRRDDIPKSEQPPRKRLCLSTLGSSTVDVELRRQGISEVRYGIRDTWVDPAEAIPEVAPMTVDMRRKMDDMQAELLALRGQQRARQPGPDARIPDHQDASRDADSHI